MGKGQRCHLDGGGAGLWLGMTGAQTAGGAWRVLLQRETQTAFRPAPVRLGGASFGLRLWQLLWNACRRSRVELVESAPTRNSRSGRNGIGVSPPDSQNSEVMEMEWSSRIV